ncbi:MAG TPA: zinc ribbon domain-containing protein [Spirochaetia bacterium]|nr:zinc ribbon domain-containing protein [Spirochaetia bacterium]
MKRARFFCENCRNEVRWDAKVCPHCGRFFSSVKCPSCEFVGESRLFVFGCPNCGYAGGEAFISREAAIAPGPDVETYPLETFDAAATRGGTRIPPWVYPLAIGILLTTFTVLVIVYLTMSR